MAQGCWSLDALPNSSRLLTSYSKARTALLLSGTYVGGIVPYAGAQCGLLLAGHFTNDGEIFYSTVEAHF